MTQIQLEISIPHILLKVEVIHEGKRYIATQPLAMAIVDSGYDISLAGKVLDLQVLCMPSDGTRPSYDSTNPFKVIVKKEKNIDGEIVDYSLSDKFNL